VQLITWERRGKEVAVAGLFYGAITTFGLRKVKSNFSVYVLEFSFKMSTVVSFGGLSRVSCFKV
jgi:hypothetical protein